jgi:hypothetical protein
MSNAPSEPLINPNSAGFPTFSEFRSGGELVRELGQMVRGQCLSKYENILQRGIRPSPKAVKSEWNKSPRKARGIGRITRSDEALWPARGRG